MNEVTEKMLAENFTQNMQYAINSVFENVKEYLLLNQKDYLDEEQAAFYMSIPQTSLKTKRCKGQGPDYIKDGAKVLYKRKDIDEYLNARRVRCNNLK